MLYEKAMKLKCLGSFLIFTRINIPCLSHLPDGKKDLGKKLNYFTEYIRGHSQTTLTTRGRGRRGDSPNVNVTR